MMIFFPTCQRIGIHNECWAFAYSLQIENTWTNKRTNGWTKIKYKCFLRLHVRKKQQQQRRRHRHQQQQQLQVIQSDCFNRVHWKHHFANIDCAEFNGYVIEIIMRRPIMCVLVVLLRNFMVFWTPKWMNSIATNRSQQLEIICNTLMPIFSSSISRKKHKKINRFIAFLRWIHRAVFFQLIRLSYSHLGYWDYLQRGWFAITNETEYKFIKPNQNRRNATWKKREKPLSQTSFRLRCVLCYFAINGCLRFDICTYTMRGFAMHCA